MKARVIGLGQPLAGDDGVGLRVVQQLRCNGVSPGTELMEAVEPSALIPLLTVSARVILVDAAVGAGPPGRVLHLTPQDLPGSGTALLSTHGFGVTDAIAMARLLYPDMLSPDIHVVAVTIAPPEPYSHTLSLPVAAALPRAIEQVKKLLTEKRVSKRGKVHQGRTRRPANPTGRLGRDFR